MRGQVGLRVERLTHEALPGTEQDETAVLTMMSSTSSSFRLTGFRYGMRAAVAAIPGYIVFAMAFGAAAAQKGLTAAQSLGLSAFVYAGSSQLVSLEIWPKIWSPATILTVVTVTAVINARLILLGATLQPWLAPEAKSFSLLNLFLITEANWLIGTHYRNEGGRDIGVLFGAGLILWIVWGAATLAGYFAGAFVPDPRRFGLDLVMPIFFCSMLVPLWKGMRPALPWLVSGIVAVTIHFLVPGYLFILAGALSGILTGVLVE